MLPPRARMRAAQQFRHTVRSGTRAGRPTVVVHAARAADASTQVQVGFVVAKSVGNAVVRNRVKRRLRHLARVHLSETPVGLQVVVRALPRAAEQPAELPVDLSRAWSRAVHRVTESAQA